jgi:hypothetical protein
MPNYPGPLEIEFEILVNTTPARSHVFRSSVIGVGDPDLGTPLADVTLLQKDGTNDDAQTLVDQYWNFLRLMFHTGTICTSVTLWKYVPNTFQRDFVTASEVTNPAGTNSAGPIPLQQHMLTFRSAGGGIIKLSFLEAAYNGDQQIPLTANPVGFPSERIASYMLSGDCIVIGRDNGFPIAALRESLGENEKIWRKVNRPT